MKMNSVFKKYRIITNWDNEVKRCIVKALNETEKQKNIKYKNTPYDFSVMKGGMKFSTKYNYSKDGFYIYLQDDQNNEISYIHILLEYNEMQKKNGKGPYLAKIHRLRTQEKYRRNGYATYLMGISLLVADMLNVKRITVNNLCVYREFYSLFNYNSKKIEEYM